MSGPKQFVTVGGVRIATEDFIKDRENILKRLAKEEPKEKGQMMNKPVNLAQEKFEKVLEETKQLEQVVEIDDETLVTFVESTQTSDAEDSELIVDAPEEEKASENKKVVKKPIKRKKK